LCSQIKVLLKENYFEKSFLINASLISQSNSFSLRSLINSDFVIYTLIHDKLIDKVYQKLEIQSILLAKKKLIWDYDEKLARKTITHKILFNLTIKSHKKLTMSMLIAKIKHHEAILSKFWMNKNEILLNMRHDTIIFSDQLNTSISIFLISSNTKHSSWLQSTSIFSVTHSKISKMLKHSVSFFQKESFSIQNINVASFQALVKWKKKNQTEIFAMFIKDIDRKIVYNTSLIIKLSFELTFWTWINIESSCSHFQLDSSRVAHIFNLTQLDSTRNWVNLTQLIKNSNLTSRALRIET